MILTIDIGNTNVCFSCFPEDRPEPLFLERVATDAGKTPEEYAKYVRYVLRMHALTPADVSLTVLSSVVPKAEPILKEAAKSVIPAPLLTIDSTLDLGFEIRIYDPAELGHDIICDTAGALYEYGAPAITFDLGTATVASLLLEDPAMVGVLITPGVKTSLRSLSKRTSILPSIALTAPKNVIGTNTRDSMLSGIVYGTAGAIDRIIDEMEREAGKPCRHLITGGLSPVIAPWCSHEMTRDSALLMKGMWHLAKRNPDRAE